MVQSSRPSIQIDLSEFKLHLHLKSRTQLTFHFNSPSRRFYLSVIALVVNEMKKLGRIISIPLQEHLDLLVLLNKSVGGSAGSSKMENLLHIIYRKWKYVLPNLEEAPLFKVLGKKKEGGDGAVGKIYSFTDAEKDGWANLFEYVGSEENVRLKFAVDKIGVSLNETSIIFGDSLNADAWDQFIFSLKDGRKEESEPVEESVAIDYSKPKSYTPKSLADKILTTRSSIEGERKLVTVFFADVANYTSMFEKLDPEEVHQIVDGCFKILMGEIHKYEGTITQFTGDGVMALFGAPIAHEDHAQRACRSALDIQRVMEGYGEKIRKDYGLDFRLRVGLSSGPVIVGFIGDDLRMDYRAIGDTVNMASRMEGLARPGSVLVSRDTHRLVVDFFRFEPLGKVLVKGKEELQEAYELISPSGVETHFAASVARGLTRFVGRQNSMAALMETYEKVREGSGQVVEIVGEAGVGKSRLLLEFRGRLSQGEFAYLEGRCIHFGGTMAYLPLLDILRSYFGIKEGEQEFLIQRKMKERVRKLDEKLQSILSPLQDLLSLKVEDEQYLKLEPKQRRERIFEALRDLFVRLSQESILILAVEDLHWIDRTSEEFLDYLIGWLANARILLILLHRPEYTHQWGSKSYFNRIGLTQLTLKSSAELVQAILEEGEVAPELRDLILSRAGGNPLFMEELIHTLLENGSIQMRDHQYVLAQRPSELQVPETIQGIIAARMDRLEENLKRTMQVASVIGREFAFRILQAISGMREELKSHLRNLQGLEFIYEKSLFPEIEYIFKHALIQEVAYNSLLLKRRKEIHERIGLAIEEVYADRLEEFYEVLAYHFERAGIADKALKYLQFAGEKAVRLAAYEEAIAHLNRALELVQALPESKERDEQELALRLALAAPLQAARGYSVPELRQSNARAFELCQRMGESPQIIPALWLLWASDAVLTSEHQKSIELAERLLTVAQRSQVPLQITIARWAMGVSLLYIGDFTANLPHLEHVIDFYDFQQHRSLVYLYGMDPGVYCLAWTTWVLWLLGYPDQALKRSQESVALARELNHPMTLVFALNVGGAYFHLFRRENRIAQDYADSTLKLAVEAGLPYWQAIAMLELGWLKKEKGQVEEGIDQMQQGIAAVQSMGVQFGNPWYVSWVAEGYGVLGQIEKGLGLMEEALSFVEKTGERLWEAEIHRVKGDLLQSCGRVSEAEASFRQAIEVARRQQAKSWELRATMSLSRLLQKEGRSEEARPLLSEIYRWFTEGFDTPDLKEARALLDELGGHKER